MPIEPQSRHASRALRIVLGINMVLWLLLVITGIVLMFVYRPTAAAAYADIVPSQSSVRFGQIVRSGHRWCSAIAVITVLAIPITYFIEGRNRSGLVSILTVVAVAAASYTGLLLPWDQLALWAVTTGTNIIGYTAAFRDDVRFVLLGGVEIGSDTLLRWFILHVAVLPILLAAVAYVAHRFARRRED